MFVWISFKFAFDTLSDPEKRRLHDIQIYGTDESYTEASTPYGDTGLTEESYQEIYEATKVHLHSLHHVIETFFTRPLEKLRAGGNSVSSDDFANYLLEWYHGIDSEVFSHCQRISLLLPDTHDVLIKEIKKIRKICGNHVETITKEAYPRLVNIIKKGGSLSPNQNSIENGFKHHPDQYFGLGIFFSSLYFFLKSSIFFKSSDLSFMVFD